MRNPIAWAALLLSITSTAVASSRYLITSTSQIKPSVRAQLHGQRGPTGPTGADGLREVVQLDFVPKPEPGMTGAQGTTGRPGPTGVGVPGCGEEPPVTWTEHSLYRQSCHGQSTGEGFWRYLIDPNDHHEYLCTHGAYEEIDGQWCRDDPNPGHKILHEHGPATIPSPSQEIALDEAEDVTPQWTRRTWTP